MTTTTAFSSVTWYVAGPGESGLGTNVETDYGGSNYYSASLSYSFSTSGDYVVTAYIYNYSDSSVYQTSYTVNVSGSSSSSTSPSPPSSEPCIYCHDEELEVVCTKCGATYHRCTSTWGDCPEGDLYHYTDYAWQ